MVKTIKDIDQIRDTKIKAMGGRLGSEDEKIYIMTCCGTGCTSSGSMKSKDKLAELIKRDGMEDKVQVIKTGCFGLCAEGPIVVIQPENIMYTQVQPDDINEIWEAHIKNGRVVQ